MRAPVRELTFVQKILYKISQITVSLVIVFLLGSSLLPQTFAQTSTAQNPTIDHYLTPRVDANVPQNLGTLTQSITLEVMATLVCQIAGIDPIAPTQPCLGVNPQSGQLGYTQTANGDGEVKVGGLLGMTPGLFATLYTPTTSTAEYVRYMGQSFGIVKSAYAAAPTGFDALKPVLELWKAMRNIAYMILILAFIFIGLGVMLRIKIDPRTVMTIQNQVPRIVICILLITFSYPIAGLMVDGMWLVTYAGINVITTAGANPSLGSGGTLSQESTKNILQTPLAFINSVQSTDNNAYIHITDAVSKGISAFFGDIVASIFNTGAGDTDCSILNFSIKNCVGAALGTVVDWILRVVLYLIIFTTLLVTLFRIWFMLLKAYVFVLLYVIGAPIWIVFGLLPGRPLGFEKWIRAMFVNLMAFPLVAFVFVGGRVLSELFKDNPGDKFVTPLTGNPSMENFGVLIAFGLLLMAPRILTMLQEAMKTPGTKHGAAIGAGLAAGAAPVAAFAGNRWQHLNKVNPHTGEAIGMVARKKQEIGEKVLQTASKIKVPGAAGALANKQFLRSNHQSFGGTTQKERTTDFKANDWWKKNNMEEQYKQKYGKASEQKDRSERYAAWKKDQPGIIARIQQRKNRKGGPETPPPTPPTNPVVPPTGPKTSPQGGGAAATPPTEKPVKQPEQGATKTPPQAPQEGKKEPPTEHVGTLNVNADKANVTISGEHAEPKEGDHDANAPTHGIMPHNQHDPKWVEKLKEKGNEELHGKSLEQIGGDPVLKQKYERLLAEYLAEQKKNKNDKE